MGIDVNKLVIIAEPKLFILILLNMLSIIKRNEFLAEHRIKNEIMQLLSKYKHGKDIHKYRKQ